MTQPSDLQEIANALRGHDRFLVVTHENPDGDALGSLLAVTVALRGMGKDVAMYLPAGAPLPREYGFMALGELSRVPPATMDAEQRGRVDEATAELFKSTTVAPDRAGGYLMGAKLLLASGDRVGAEKAYRQALRVEPDSSIVRPPLYHFLEAYAADLGAHVQQLNPADPERRRLEWQMVAMRNESSQLRVRQLQIMKADVQRAPELFAVQLAYGELLAEGELWKPAEEALLAAERLEPNSVEAARALCQLYIEQKSWDPPG